MNATDLSSPQVHSDSLLAIGIVEVLLFFTGTLGNVLPFVAVMRNQRLRFATNYYVVSLSVADLLVTAILVPVRAVEHIWRSQGHHIIPEILLDVVVFIGRATILASFANLAVMSLDRLVALKFPLRYRTQFRYSARTSLAIISVTWFISIFVTLLGEFPEISPKRGMIEFSVFSLTMTVIILISYINIFILVRKQSRYRMKIKIKLDEAGRPYRSSKIDAPFIDFRSDEESREVDRSDKNYSLSLKAEESVITEGSETEEPHGISPLVCHEMVHRESTTEKSPMLLVNCIVNGEGGDGTQRGLGLKRKKSSYSNGCHDDNKDKPYSVGNQEINRNAISTQIPVLIKADSDDISRDRHITPINEKLDGEGAIEEHRRLSSNRLHSGRQSIARKISDNLSVSSAATEGRRSRSPSILMGKSIRAIRERASSIFHMNEYAYSIDDKRTAKAIAIVISCFILLVYPRIALVFYHITYAENQRTATARLWLRTLIYTNSVLNPALYAWRMNEFRREFKLILLSCVKKMKWC